MREATNKEILKLLNTAELLVYVFEQKLPADFQLRLKTKNGSKLPEQFKGERNLKLLKLGLSERNIVPKASQTWQAIAIVLPIHKGACRNCGTSFEAPFGKPLIKRVHPAHGTHLKLPETQEELDQLAELPHEKYYSVEELNTCHACFQGTIAIPESRQQGFAF